MLTVTLCVLLLLIIIVILRCMWDTGCYLKDTDNVYPFHKLPCNQKVAEKEIHVCEVTVNFKDGWKDRLIKNRALEVS